MSNQKENKEEFQRSWAIGPSVLVLHPELVHQGEDKITKNGHEQLLFIRVQ
jgi:hypothetical protein